MDDSQQSSHSQELYWSHFVLEKTFSVKIYLIDYLEKLNLDCSSVEYRPSEGAVLRGDDSFSHFLKTTVLCSNNGEARSFNPSKLFLGKRFLSRREIFTQVTFMRRYGRNCSSRICAAKSDLHRSFGRDRYFCSQFPNVDAEDIVCQVENSLDGHWRLLHKVAGDDVMMHLFTSFSVFVAVNSAILLQVGGSPVVSLWENGAPLSSTQDDEKHPDGIDAGNLYFNTIPPCKRKRTTQSSQGKGNEARHTGLKRKGHSARSRPTGSNNSNVKGSRNRRGTIKKSIIFTSSLERECIPNGFVLKQCASTHDCTKKLMAKVFPCSQYKGLHCRKSQGNAKARIFRKPWQKKFINLLKGMLRHHKKTNYQCLLDHYCPLTGELASNAAACAQSKASVSVSLKQYQDASNSFIPKHKVFLFVKAVCRRLIPLQLLGCKENRLVFMKNVKALLYQQKYEKMNVSNLMNGIKISSIRWLSCDGKIGSLEHFRRNHHVLVDVILFLVNKVILPIISFFFHASEKNKQRNKVFFYRKKVWHVIQQFAMLQLSENFEEISKANVLSRIQQNKCLGVSQLKLVPKERSIRPIVNMSGRCSSLPGTAIPINIKLKNVFAALLREQDSRKEEVSASVIDLNEVGTRLLDFTSKNKQNIDDKQQLYMVSVDVASCYDSIPHDKLLQVLRLVFKSEDFIFRCFQCLTVVKDGSVKKKVRRFALPGDDCSSFKFFLKKCHAAGGLKANRGCVVSSPVIYGSENRAELMAVLVKLIQNNIVQFGNRFYKQTRGIPQGSKVSSLLCDFFLSHMEMSLLPDILEREDSLLMRFVDDSLLITTSKDVADKFLHTMTTTIAEYGCSINPKKTLVNVPFSINGQDMPVVDGRHFPWCGLLIDTQTLEIRANYGLYASTFIRDLICVNVASRPGRSIRNALVQTVKNKALPLLLDMAYNSNFTVLLNVYQVFLFAAKKFHVLIKRLPKGRSVNSNVRFFLFDVILYLPLELIRSYQRKVSNVEQLGSGSFIRSVCVRRLCLLAFHDVLSTAPTCYIRLLPQLKKHLRRALVSHDLPIELLRQQSAIFRKIK